MIDLNNDSQVNNNPTENNNIDTNTNNNNEWLPEEYREDKTFSKFEDVSSLAKSYKELQGLIGKKGGAIPTDESSDDDWNNFYKSLGVPESAEEYKFSTDEELKLPDYFSDDTMTKLYQTAFKEANLTPKQAQTLWNIRNKWIADEITADQAKVAAAENELKKDWGDNFESELNKAKQAFHTLFPDIDPKNYPLANNLDFIRVMNKVHGLIADDKLIRTNKQPDNKAAIQSRIDEILANPDYKNAMSPNQGNLITEMIELQEKLVNMG